MRRDLMAEAAARTAGPASEKGPVSRDSVLALFERELKVSPEEGARLYEAGLHTVSEVRSAPVDRLRALGLGDATVVRLTQGAPRAQGGDELLEKWLQHRASRSEPSQSSRKRVVPLPRGARSDSTDLVKKWMSGEGGVDTLMKGPEGGAGAASPGSPPPPPPPAAPPPSLGEPPPSLPDLGARAASAQAQEIQEREETVLRWLTELLEKVRRENFDPGLLLQEARDLSRQVHEERARRRQLEEDLEHVKKGSVAVIKYVRTREARAREEAVSAREEEIHRLRRQLETVRAGQSETEATRLLEARDARIKELEGLLEQARAEGAPTEGASQEMGLRFQEELAEKDRVAAEREGELRRKIIQLEEALQNARAEQDLAAKHADLAKLGKRELNAELRARLEALDARERTLVARENDLKAKVEELMVRADELERKRAPLQFKENEFIKWEENLRIKEETLKTELRRLEEQKKVIADPEVLGKLKRLENLEAEITKREEEIQAREGFLHQKMEEIESKERALSEAEVKKAEEELQAELTANKVRSGIPRLDDLLFGGIPPGTNILVNGPAHTGKEIMGRLLAVEGLKKGIPVVFVLSDKATTTVREEMQSILPAYPEYEKQGLVRYVDLYSMSLGISSADPLVTLLSVDDKNLLENLSRAVDEASQEFRKTHGYYRLIFESLSTVTAYLDTANTFRFLQPFTGKRKLEKAVAYYLLETGMHGESDIQTLEHMMDGSINLKVDQLKTYLSVKGIGEVQSRAWIAYTFTKKVFNIGSFSLDHIR